MGGRFINNFFSQLEESENSPENSGDSPRSAVSNDTKIASTSSSKRSRRAIQKRVVSVPIKDIEGFRLKGDQMSAPPSDSWAWRKYGQKPIKGSPYPRGYYRCSSSKGCPARKQVERSRADPNMLVVTYSCEHNHPWPASRNHHHNNNHHAAAAPAAAAANAATSVSEEDEEEEEEEEKKPIINQTNQSHEIVPEFKFAKLDDGLLIQASEFGWFTDFESTSCIMLESPILTEDRISTDNEMAMIFTMREDDESLFADLGELPECSTVFRRGIAQREAEQRRHSLATTS
ncbi:hypothetical protein BUALT_Bualt03G0039800 [Buddleja alternifolia]|uniref:WRKY domain-containing protein n=1 Tax=Buddleja alternifolia TaxID=168488 RepID=A0AAV6XXQ6_9LAMI|nr:hypothetical protein BUALT_Bualt03G0039800 [Buddleja alternifolia]